MHTGSRSEVWLRPRLPSRLRRSSCLVISRSAVPKSDEAMDDQVHASASAEEAPAVEGEQEEDPEDDDAYETFVAPGVSIHFPWGEEAYKVAGKMMSEDPTFEHFAIYSFKTRHRSRLEIALDKTDDPRGSPTLDDVALFARSLRTGLEAVMGDKADALEIEVSTAGAEREIRLPHELERFRQFPMRVVYRNSTAGGAEMENVMDFKGMDPDDSSLSEWRLADVKANRWVDKRGKVMPLRRRDKDRQMLIPVVDLVRVYMHLDA